MPYGIYIVFATTDFITNVLLFKGETEHMHRDVFGTVNSLAHDCMVK
jgi:hypothetical protein